MKEELIIEKSTFPFVSVVIPTYNHALFLKRALQSVIDQTYANWEAIVIDNHSRDRTEQVVASFSDPRISLLKIHNKGVIAASRNLGIRVARGEWVAFLDSDDWWKKEKLANSMKNSINYDLIYHRLRYYSLADSSIIRFHGLVDALDISLDPYRGILQYGPVLTTSGTIVKKQCIEAVGYFDEADVLVGGEDLDLWFRLASQGCKFCFINDVLGCYLTGGSHVTSVSRALKINKYLTTKHFSTGHNDVPPWIHASQMRSLAKLGHRREMYKYIRLFISSQSPQTMINFIAFSIKKACQRLIALLS